MMTMQARRKDKAIKTTLDRLIIVSMIRIRHHVLESDSSISDSDVLPALRPSVSEMEYTDVFYFSGRS